MSKQHDTILDIIRSGEGHMTCDQIYASARQQIPNISLGTVYRNLGKMVENGEISKFSALDGPDIYDKTVLMHGHKICIKCGDVSDLKFNNVCDDIEAENDIDILSFEMVVGYLCDKCKCL